jgi:hypothetical protein
VHASVRCRGIAIAFRCAARPKTRGTSVGKRSLLVERLAEHGEFTSAARLALYRSIEHIESQGGVLDLRGQRFVLLGAAAYGSGRARKLCRAASSMRGLLC